MTTSLVKGMERLLVSTASSSDAEGVLAAPKSGSSEAVLEVPKSGTLASRKVTVPLPAVFQERFSFLGVALAEALSLFSLDVVGIVAEYGEVTVNDLGLHEEVEKAQSFSKISPEVEERVKSFGKCIKHLNLLPQKFENTLEGNPYVVDLNAMQNLLLPNFPNLESLQICCKEDAIVHLHNLPKLRHLEFGFFTAKKDTAAENPIREIEAFRRSVSQLKLHTLTFPVSVLRNVSELPHFQELTEIHLLASETSRLQTYLADLTYALQHLPKLRKLRINPHCLWHFQSYISLFKNIPLEILCLDQLHTEKPLTTFQYSPTLKTLILKDCKVDVPVSESIRSQNPNLQILFLSSTNEIDIARFKEFFNHRLYVQASVD